MKKLRAGVVGVGFIGAAHIEAVRRLGYVEVTAICDNIPDPSEIAKKLSVERWYTDYREMIEKEHLDVVHICTPNVSHFEIAKCAIAYGAAVLCEKPLAFTVSEAEELTRLAKEAGICNAVNFHSRYYPMIREMRELVRKGELGDIISIHGGYLQDWLLLDTDYSWRLESAQAGDSRAVADIGSHWIDSVEFITGLKIRRVFSDFAIFYKTRKRPSKQVETFSNKVVDTEAYEAFQVDTEDFAQVLFEFDNGARGNMIVSQMYAGRKNQMIISVAGYQKALYFDSEALNELWLGSRSGYNSSIVKDPALLEPGAAAVNAYPGGHVEGFSDAFTGAFRAFYERVRNGAEGEYATFADGLREMRICDAIVTSFKRGGWVDIKG